jgi:outer membrane protein OmpA-like peptidoglycan-associated protein
VNIKQVAAVAGFSTAIALSSGVTADEMVNNFVTSGTSSFVKDSAGSCWRTPYQDTMDKPVECGYPAPEVTVTEQVEVVAAPTAASLTTMVMEKIEIAAVMLFGFDSADLTDDAKAVIDERVDRLRGEARLTSAMRIEGHTDSTGPEAYNLALSERRAQAVADYIVSQTRLTAADVEILPMGESSPVASNDTAEGRAENRRVTIFAQGEVGQ